LEQLLNKAQSNMPQLLIAKLRTLPNSFVYAILQEVGTDRAELC